jgi:hypothetical protein
VNYERIRIRARVDDNWALTALGAFVGKYAQYGGYYEALADEETIERLRRHNWEVSPDAV